MKLFADTGSIKEIETLAALGILDGVTTNPSLVAKEGKNFRETIVEICGIVSGPVSAETVSLDWEGMVREGRELARPELGCKPTFHRRRCHLRHSLPPHRRGA